MTSTRLPAQTAGGSLPQPTDSQAREPKIVRAPSIDLEGAELDRVTTGVDLFSPAAPIVGKTVDVSKMQPVPYTVPSDGVDRRESILDPFVPPTVIRILPPGAGAGTERKTRSLRDIVMRRPAEPIWMESEKLSALFAPALRMPVGGYMGQQIASPALAPNGEVRFLATQVAPSSIYLAHFGAAVAAATARGDNNMQTHRILPTMQIESEGLPVVQHSTVVLYANTGRGHIAPIAINTDSRVHMTHDGAIRARQPNPMQFDLTFPTLESAFAKLIAAEGAYTFKPFNPAYRGQNAEAIGHALTAITGAPTAAQPIDGMSQEALQAALGDRHAAVILTFGPDQEIPVRQGETPKAQWKTYQDARKEREIASGKPAPEYTFLADVPYVVTQVYPESGHVELLNVLKHSENTTWYEVDAQHIHQALHHQATSVMRVPLALLAGIPGVQMFSSNIPYAAPSKREMEKRTIMGPQGPLEVLLPTESKRPQDVQAQQHARDAISAKLIEGAHKALRANVDTPDAARLLDMAKVSVEDEVITLRRKDDDAVIGHMLRVGNAFCWFEERNMPQVRAAIENNTAKLAQFHECLWSMAIHIGLAEAPPPAPQVAEPPDQTAEEGVGTLLYAHRRELERAVLKAVSVPGFKTLDQCAEALVHAFAEKIAKEVVSKLEDAGSTLAKDRDAFMADVASSTSALQAEIDALRREMAQATRACEPPKGMQEADLSIAGKISLHRARQAEQLLARVSDKLVSAVAAALEPRPAEAPTTVVASVTALDDATRAALRDPRVPMRFVGTEVPVQNLTAKQRADLNMLDTRPWYDRVLARNPDAGFVDFVVDSSNFSIEESQQIGTLSAPVNSVHFQTLSADLIAPSRVQTSHFAAALNAAIAVGGPTIGAALTLRSFTPAPAEADGSQNHTVVLFAGKDKGIEDAAADLVPTPIGVNNHILTAPDGTPRVMRVENTADSPERVAHEGSLPFHGYAVLENAYQKLAAHATQYIYKPFAPPAEWDNATAISHTLSAVTGNPTQATQLAWDGSKANRQGSWPVRAQNLDAGLVMFPDLGDVPSTAYDITDTTAYAGTPNFLIQDAHNDAVVLSNLPYAVASMVDTKGRNDPADIRILLHNALAASKDPTWYQDEVPQLAEIVARQSIAPLKLGQGQQHVVGNFISVSLEALQRVGATVFTSPLRAAAEPEAIRAHRAAGAPLPPPAPQARYDDVQLAAIRSAPDALALLEPTSDHAELQAWAAKLTFTIEPGDNPRAIFQARQDGPEGNIVASFVRTMPDQPVMPRETEQLLPRFNALTSQVVQVRAAMNQLMLAIQQRRVHPVAAQAELQRLQQLHQALQSEGGPLEARIKREQSQGPLPQGGVRRIVDGIPGEETTLVQLLQTVFAERQA